MNILTVGTKVERIAPEKDYTNGRKGEVIEIVTDAHAINYGRVRVMWTEEKNGSPIQKYSPRLGNWQASAVRTWVKISAVKIIN